MTHEEDIVFSQVGAVVHELRINLLSNSKLCSDTQEHVNFHHNIVIFWRVNTITVCTSLNFIKTYRVSSNIPSGLKIYPILALGTNDYEVIFVWGWLDVTDLSFEWAWLVLQSQDIGVGRACVELLAKLGAVFFFFTFAAVSCWLVIFLLAESITLAKAVIITCFGLLHQGLMLNIQIIWIELLTIYHKD